MLMSSADKELPHIVRPTPAAIIVSNAPRASSECLVPQR